jgi:hypothetical protein
LSTPQDLINAALREARIIVPDEGPSTAESQDSLLALNWMLSSWSAQGLPVYQMTRETFPLTGLLSYTIGTGGTFNTARPVKIEAATVIDSAGAGRPVKLGTVEEWVSYADKSRSGVYADLLWYDGAYPLATIYLIPKPVTGSTIEIYSYKSLVQFATLADTVSLPPGYERALVMGLALELWNQYRQGDPPASVVAKAQEAKAAVFGLNQAVLGAPGTVASEPPAPISAPAVPTQQ